MKTSLSISALPTGVSLETALAQAAQTGFQGVELVAGPNGTIPLNTPADQGPIIGKLATTQGLVISSLAIIGPPDINPAAPEASQRSLAREQICTALNLAAGLGTSTVVMTPAIVGLPDQAVPLCRYEEAYARALETLLDLRFEAEQRAVRLACRCGAHGFLLSPLETRDFIGRINSAWVGASLDTANLPPLTYPQDWIRTLGGSLFHIYARRVGIDRLMDSNLEEALRAASYDGFVTQHSS